MVLFHGIAALVFLILSGQQSRPGTGILEVKVRDDRTHYAVRAKVRAEAPGSFEVETDANGIARIKLPAGDHRFSVSAPGYAEGPTHYTVVAGKTTTIRFMLHSEAVPKEERDAVLSALERPGYTLLHGYLVDAATGRPVEGAVVRLIHAGVTAKTDKRGHYDLLVRTPAPACPGGMGVDTVVYRKSGYKRLMLEHFGIPSEDMGGPNELQPGEGVVRVDATHKLMRDCLANKG